MTGFKTIAFWVFVFCAIGIGIYAYFNLKNNKKPKEESLSVLPDSCLVYLNSNNLSELNKKINSQSLITDKLKLFKEVNFICTTLNAFDSLFNYDELLQEELNDNLIHLAAYEKKGWIAVFNIKRLGEGQAIADHLAKILNATLSGEEIYEFDLNKRRYYYSIKSGIARIASTKEIIALSFDKARSKLENSHSFAAFKNTLNNNDLLCIYVNHSLYSKSNVASHLDLSYILEKGASGGAIDFQPSQVKINGYINPDSSEIVSSFADQYPQPSNEIAGYLPVNTISFKAYGFSSFASLKLKTNRETDNFWKKGEEVALYNLESDFNANIGKHAIGFKTVSEDDFITVEVMDTLKAQEHLKFMSDSLITMDSLVIYKLREGLKKGSPLKLFSPLLNQKTYYAALFNSHIIFSEHEHKLVQIVRTLSKSFSLLRDESFTSYAAQHFPDDFNYLLYNSPARIKNEIPLFLSLTPTSKEYPFGNFKHFSFSLSRFKNNFKFRLHLMNGAESSAKEQSTLWTCNLDTTSSMRVQNFVNHNTGENELVVQDDANTLYLINAKGTVLWKKKIGEKIISEIHLVDIFKKNKFQMLFNTKNYIHLIDRNGKYVEGYPVKLPSEASAQLSLFDYENNKDYRIIIPCKNRTIYNYSVFGIRQEKFSPVKTDNEVNLPVQYVKVAESDYLVALDSEGKIYTFSRKGTGRLGLRNRTIANCEAFYIDPGNSINNSFLIYVDDKNGIVNKISFADKKEIVKLNGEIENASANFSQVDDNRSTDLIFTKDNSIVAYDLAGNIIEEKETEMNLSETGLYTDESHSLFYCLTEDHSEVVVLDRLKQTQGLTTKIYKGNCLPLISNLFKDNKKYLIITNGKQINCVSLN